MCLVPVMVLTSDGGQWLVDPHWVARMALRNRFLIFLVVEDSPGGLPGLGGVGDTAQAAREGGHPLGIVHTPAVPLLPVLEDTVGHVGVVVVVLALVVWAVVAVQGLLLQVLLGVARQVLWVSRVFLGVALELVGVGLVLLVLLVRGVAVCQAAPGLATRGVLGGGRVVSTN